MKGNHNCPSQGKECTFLKIADNLGWFVTVDGKWNVMPHIYSDDGEQYRVNYCPSCGHNVRDIIIPSADTEDEELLTPPGKNIKQ